MILTSPDFKHNDFIPRKFTCQGPNISPRLIIGMVPAEAKSLALIVNDVDAPSGDWTHWLVYDMPVISKIDEGGIPGKEGRNSFGKVHYGGPCPPSGIHRYFFTVYALDQELNLQVGADREALEKAMKDRIIDQTELVGLYKKS
jgi:hypothetical protein